MTISKEQAIKEAREVWGQPIVVVESDQVKLCEFANRMFNIGAATKELEVVRLKLELENEKRK